MTGFELYLDNKDENILLLNQFFDQNLGLQVEVEDYFFLGKSFPKPVVVEFQRGYEKRLVMKNKSLLKDLNSPRKVFINDYVPLVTQEKRRRERKIINDIEASIDPNDEEADPGVTYTKAGLTIQGTPYRKKIKPPSPRDLLDLEADELKRILNIETKRGEQLTKDNSKFFAYLIPATTYQQIKEAYMKLKLVQPNARHIVCAYVIQGPTFQAHDFQDDGEPGAG